MSGWKDDDAVTITYRTLRQAQAEAAAAEQERIIKLLDAEIGSGHCDRCDHELEGCEVADLIALIKGKN